jgi:hypothetical protein
MALPESSAGSRPFPPGAIYDFLLIVQKQGAHLPKITERYVIEKTVELCVEIAERTEVLRIEALLDTSTGRYTTRGYVQVDISPSFAYPGQMVDRNISIWASYSLPWTDRPTADEAIQQAVSLANFHQD